jgi:hypothetical protein
MICLEKQRHRWIEEDRSAQVGWMDGWMDYGLLKNVHTFATNIDLNLTPSTDEQLIHTL